MLHELKVNLQYRKVYAISAFFYFLSLAIFTNAKANNKINMKFDPSFLHSKYNDNIDLSGFSNGTSALQGNYNAALYLNEKYINNIDVEIVKNVNDVTYPCITKSILTNISLNYDKLPNQLISSLNSGEKCININDDSSGIEVYFDSNQQQLDITIPQIYLLSTPRDYVSPEFWDGGISTFKTGYNINGYTSKYRGETFNSIFAGINSGLNYHSWYLRHNGSFYKNNNESGKYTSVNTYLQRDLLSMKARVLIGQSNTSGNIFDTIPFTGVELATDERMLPPSQRGYAPDIRGFASSNARVVIRQNGLTLYETTVSPGEFLINDLYPTGYGGDLDVSVYESDGTEKTFKVPYASVAQLLRPGISSYTLTGGMVRSDNLKNKPSLYQATYQRGLTNSITGYGGFQASDNYYSLQLGSAFGTKVGAFSFDTTHAYSYLGKSTYNENKHNNSTSINGQSYQIKYSKTISESNSNISLAAYRFSTDGYMDFMTAMQSKDIVSYGGSPDTILRAKNRITLTAGQGLPNNFGQIYISSSLQDYWNKDGSQKHYQLGYNNRYKNISYGLNINRSFSPQGISQTNYLLNLSLPLGKEYDLSRPQLTMGMSHNNSGQLTEQATISGIAGNDNQLSYGFSAINANQGAGASTIINGNYRTLKSSLSGSLGISDHYKNASIGINGTLLAHDGGIVLSPYTSDTFALVEAKGAEGAKVSSYPGIAINSSGYALIPYLNPYQMNEISIDPKGMSNNIEFINTSQKIAPFLGAVVKVKYPLKEGNFILIDAKYQDKPIPFGANVFDIDNNNVGSVGQGGKLYALVKQKSGLLKVRWGNKNIISCDLNYVIENKQEKVINQLCR